MTDHGEVTELLHAYAGGDRDAFDRLVPMVDDELRRIARNHLSYEQLSHSLETGRTVLIHKREEEAGRDVYLEISEDPFNLHLSNHSPPEEEEYAEEEYAEEEYVEKEYVEEPVEELDEISRILQKIDSKKREKEAELAARAEQDALEEQAPKDE